MLLVWFVTVSDLSKYSNYFPFSSVFVFIGERVYGPTFVVAFKIVVSLMAWLSLVLAIYDNYLTVFYSTLATSKIVRSLSTVFLSY